MFCKNDERRRKELLTGLPGHKISKRPNLKKDGFKTGKALKIIKTKKFLERPKTFYGLGHFKVLAVHGNYGCTKNSLTSNY